MVTQKSDTELFPKPNKEKYNFKNVPLNDPRVWALFDRGDTVGIFQLETKLGQDWSKRLKPENIEELAALVSILRPGPIESHMSDSYVQRKHGQEDITYLTQALEPILKLTYGTLIYQEQVIRICQGVAGFTEVEADLIRKSMGKKLAEEMSKNKAKFIEGCVKTGKANKEEAEKIFGWIEKGQRYIFNKCVTPDTTVETPNGTKMLSEIKIGDRVLAPSKNGDVFVTVKNIYDNGEKETLEVFLRSNKSIKCTSDHQFLCNDGQKRKLSELIQLGKDIFYNNDRIVNIAYHGRQSVMDIEVDSDDHVYYGNKIAISNSHGVSYGIHAYLSAYQKVHFPTEFYCAWLTFSDWKPDPKEEIYRLVQDAKLHNITILPPDVLRNNSNFTIDGPEKILFGLSHIRNVGEAAIRNINTNRSKIGSWDGFLSNINVIKRNVAESLIKSGACDRYGLSRSEMLKQLKLVYGYINEDADGDLVYKALSPKELEHIRPIIAKEGLAKGLQSILDNDICIAKRKTLIEDKVKHLQTSVKDTNKQKSMWEKIYLSLSLSCSAIDDVKLTEKDLVTIREIYNNPPGETFKTCVLIDDKRICKTSKKAKTPDQDYAYLSVSDRTGALSNVVCWPKNYDEHASKLAIGNVVVLEVKKDVWRDREQVVVNDVEMVG